MSFREAAPRWARPGTMVAQRAISSANVHVGSVNVIAAPSAVVVDLGSDTAGAPSWVKGCWSGLGSVTSSPAGADYVFRLSGMSRLGSAAAQTLPCRRPSRLGESLRVNGAKLRMVSLSFAWRWPLALLAAARVIDSAACRRVRSGPRHRGPDPVQGRTSTLAAEARPGRPRGGHASSARGVRVACVKAIEVACEVTGRRCVR